MTLVQKAWMDWAGYGDLLRAQRFTDMNETWSEEALRYFDERMTEEVSKFTAELLAMMSKSVGWRKLTCGPRETFIPEEWAKARSVYVD